MIKEACEYSEFSNLFQEIRMGSSENSLDAARSARQPFSLQAHQKCGPKQGDVRPCPL
jgi:hypothetical protein